MNGLKAIVKKYIQFLVMGIRLGLIQLKMHYLKTVLVRCVGQMLVRSIGRH